MLLSVFLLFLTYVLCVHFFVFLYNNFSLVSLAVPSCPSRVMSDFVSDCTKANVTCQQPPNTPPDTFTTVTYLPTGNSTTCTTNPCSISGLDPCVEYNMSAIPTNNCGNATGCSTMVVASQGQYRCSVVVNNIDAVHTDV